MSTARNWSQRRTGRGNCFLVVPSKHRKTSLKCPPTCVSDTRSYSKAICGQLLRDKIRIRKTAPTPRTQMTMTTTMEKTLNPHRSRSPLNHLRERSFRIQSHFDRQRRNSAEPLDLV